MVIRRISPFSAAKMSATLYALLGLLMGALLTLLSFTSLTAGMRAYGALFGVGAIIILPIVYGVIGFVTGGISAFCFNIAASVAGGLEIDAS